MKNILLIEQSQMFGMVAKKKLAEAFDVPIYWARTYKDVTALIDEYGGDFSCALVDYNLPDAATGEVLDKLISVGITSFVFTSDVNEEIREMVWSKKVADYILKDDPNSLEYVISAMRQLEKNQQTLILVVDDSKTFRTIISELLYVQKYRVLNAADGQSALKILDNYPEIQLVITDYNMPKMDGYQLCQQIRTKYKQDKMAIIGISSAEDRSIGARFIKCGANDFIEKQSFLVEEFYSRVMDCLKTIELFSKLRDVSVRDYLTGLYNRRYLFEQGQQLFDETVKSNRSLACVLLDIDHFKSINDYFGHDMGDKALCGLGRLLCDKGHKEEVLARTGGEEFCILVPDLDTSGLVDRFESLRLAIENESMALLEDGSELHFTCSMGICTTRQENLDDMIKIADAKLYEAKEAGRNCIRF